MRTVMLAAAALLVTACAPNLAELRAEPPIRSGTVAAPSAVYLAACTTARLEAGDTAILYKVLDYGKGRVHDGRPCAHGVLRRAGRRANHGRRQQLGSGGPSECRGGVAERDAVRGGVVDPR
jgi:hypothetical protein